MSDTTTTDELAECEGCGELCKESELTFHTLRHATWEEPAEVMAVCPDCEARADDYDPDYYPDEEWYD